MKYIIILLFIICFQAQSQDSIHTQNISVISAEKLNVVYRGVPNPIKIAIPGVTAFTASAPGLEKIDGDGNYILNPGYGDEVNIIVVWKMPNGYAKSEKKLFRILPFPKPTGILNNSISSSYYMAKKDLANFEVNFVFENVLMYRSNVDFGVKEYSITIPIKKNKNITYTVEGNIPSNDVIKAIQKTKSGSLIVIHKIKMWNKINDIQFDLPPSPIVIEITD